jgi:hypothetical protein
MQMFRKRLFPEHSGSVRMRRFLNPRRIRERPRKQPTGIIGALGKKVKYIAVTPGQEKTVAA